MADTMNTWSSIREGANDVERLIGQRQYNLAMIQSRQTLEIMVKALAKKNNIQARDLKGAIDELYETRAISQKTAENYHKIRMIGNKAAHENDDNPSGANMAYHLLSQELYTFANEFNTQSGRSASGSRPARRQSQKSGMRPAHRSSKRNDKTKERIFIAIAVVLLIVLAVGVVKFIQSKSTEKETETESEMQITMETTAPYVPETFPETEPETETETPRAYIVTANVLNVREFPNTDCRKLGQLQKGAYVHYVEDVDEDWVKIDYEGTEAYVNKSFITLEDITPEEDLAPEEEEAE